jgi:hypothetical protein
MTARRVLISIDERLLARVDDACARRGLSRSAYLAQLADAELAGGSGPGLDPDVRAALTTITELVGARER